MSSSIEAGQRGCSCFFDDDRLDDLLFDPDTDIAQIGTFEHLGIFSTMAAIHVCAIAEHLPALTELYLSTGNIGEASARATADVEAAVHALCREHDVTEEQEQPLRSLHDLGTVLSFDDPESPHHVGDTDILSPEWVAHGKLNPLVTSCATVAQSGSKAASNPGKSGLDPLLQ